MRSVTRSRRKWKRKVSERREGVKTMQAIAEIDDIEVKVSLIQALIPVGLEKLGQELQQEVKKLTGPKGTHGKENTRWVRQWGSVYMLDQKVPVKIPRVRDKARNAEVPLEIYQKM